MNLRDLDILADPNQPRGSDAPLAIRTPDQSHTHPAHQGLH
jgi:hypothetical protein